MRTMHSRYTALSFGMVWVNLATGSRDSFIRVASRVLNHCGMDKATCFGWTSSYSLTEFMDFIPFGKSILQINVKPPCTSAGLQTTNPTGDPPVNQPTCFGGKILSALSRLWNGFGSERGLPGTSFSFTFDCNTYCGWLRSPFRATSETLVPDDFPTQIQNRPSGFNHGVLWCNLGSATIHRTGRPWLPPGLPRGGSRSPGSGSSQAEDRSSEARGCSETYTPFVQMSLANHMPGTQSKGRAGLGRWAVGDLEDLGAWGVVFFWKRGRPKFV